MPPPKIKIHGIRQQVPAGYVLGRVDQGGGDTQLISLRELGQHLVKTGTIQAAYTTTLKSLKDVTLGTASDKQVISYVLVDGKWENVTLTLAGGYLGDVALSGPTNGQVLSYNGTDWVNTDLPASSTALADDTDVAITSPADDDILVYNAAAAKWENEGFPIFIQKDCGDETTAITAGTGKKTFRMPHAMVLSAVRASLTTAQATNGTGGIFTVDVKQNGVSIFSTLLTIDNTEFTSTTAATAAVLATTQLYDDDEMRIDVTQIGDGTATGLKVTFIGTRSNAVVVTGGGPYFGPGYFATGYFGVYA